MVVWVLLYFYTGFASGTGEIKMHELGVYKDQRQCNWDAMLISKESMENNAKINKMGVTNTSSAWGECVRTIRPK